MDRGYLLSGRPNIAAALLLPDLSWRYRIRNFFHLLVRVRGLLI
jgi:hypothetical protein